MIAEKFETSLATKVDNYCGDASRDITERFIKRRALKMFGHTAYYIYGPIPLITESGPYEEFLTVLLGYR